MSGKAGNSSNELHDNESVISVARIWLQQIVSELGQGSPPSKSVFDARNVRWWKAPTVEMSQVGDKDAGHT